MKISAEEFRACRVKGFQKAMLFVLGFGIGFLGSSSCPRPTLRGANLRVIG